MRAPLTAAIGPPMAARGRRGAGEILAGRGPGRSVRTRELRRPSVPAVSSQVKINSGGWASIMANAAGTDRDDTGADLALNGVSLDIGGELDHDISGALTVDAGVFEPSSGLDADPGEAW